MAARGEGPGAEGVDSWGWVHIEGLTVQFSARTYPSPGEARAGLQAHLDAHAGAAARQLRELPDHVSYRASAHLPGHTWRVDQSHREVRIFAGDDYHTYRRPAAAAAPLSGPAPAKARRVSMMAESPLLRRIQVVGGLIMLGGVGAAFSSNFEGDRVQTLLLFPVGLALLVSPALLDLLGLRREKGRRGE